MHTITDKLKVTDIETLFLDEKGNVSTVRFHCSFYGEDFYADISARNIKKDHSSFSGEGPTDLYDSFESQIEGNWEKMKILFNEHVYIRKYPFLKEQFFTSGFELLSVFNNLLKAKQVVNKDMYESGTYLAAEVKDDLQSKEMLSPVINDLKAYQELNKERSYQPMSLNTIQEIHLEVFGDRYEIMWDKGAEEFELRCALENEGD
ncbi:MAG: hypothetical protein WC756_12155 [Taibaiella sp.]|jgi:hypothetical protein